MKDIFLKKQILKRPDELKRHYDVVIIGGGSHGLATAYYLATRHSITNVAVLEADPGTYQLTLQVMSPSGQQLLGRPPSMRLDVPPNTTTANIVADLKGLQVRELGRHRIELRSADRVLGTTPFNVNLAWNQPQSGNA